MKVRIVNQYFPPDRSATAPVFADFAAALRNSGNSVAVVAGRPSYDPAERRSWRFLRRERDPDRDIVIERVGSTAFDRNRPGARPANYLSFLVLAALRGLAGHRPDVIVAGSDPPLAVWAALAGAKGSPVVYSLQDLHPDMAVAAGMMKAGGVARAWDRLHTAAMRRCAVVVCLGETMADRVRAKGIPAASIVVIPGGANVDVGTADKEVVATLRAGSAFVAVHAGNIGGAGAWTTLIEANRMLHVDQTSQTDRAGQRAEILFVGDGGEASIVRDGGVRVVPFRPVQEIPSVMDAGDLQIVTQRRGMEGLVVPSKLYSILSHGRPVLAVVPATSEAARIVRDHQCGLVADPDSPAEVAQAIAWARDHPAELSKMADRSRETAKHYDRTALTDEFVRAVTSVATNAGR